MVLALALAFNRQYVADQLSVWSYTPSSAIEAMSNRVKLTDKGEFTFYATQPQLAGRDTFNEGCPRQEVGNPILGCYTYEDRIYIYDITNQQLDGMEEVTAAHEMLHAVWNRQSETERQRLATLLNKVYNRITDDSFKKRMDYYQRTEPGEFANELHSILGTEVADLGDELEAHYAQYFDRSAVLALHGQYVAVYNGLYTRSDELYQKLNTLATTIQTASDQYTADVEALSRDIESFNRRADSGDFASTAQFYSERASLVSRSATLDSQRLNINSNIDLYNQSYQEYESIAAQIELLDNSLDSFSTLGETPSL